MPSDSEESGSALNGVLLHRKLEYFADERRKVLTEQFRPVIELSTMYGRLVSRAVVSLGSTAPNSRHEVVVRDLAADVFDFLYEWPRPLFEGRPQVAFPLGRRAFESLSLLSLCIQDRSLAEAWDRGKQLGNAEIRNRLGSANYPEPVDATRSFYRFFSLGSHPNRELVAQRFLGEGNAYVLGSINVPSLLLINDQCGHLVNMWYWFGAIVSQIAWNGLSSTDETYLDDYCAAADMARKVLEWLEVNRQALLKEETSSDSS